MLKVFAGQIIRFEYQVLMQRKQKITGEVTSVRDDGMCVKNTGTGIVWYSWYNVRSKRIKVLNEVEAMIWKLETN